MAQIRDAPAGMRRAQPRRLARQPIMASPKLYEIRHLRQAAACDLRQRRMSERTRQRFTAVSQILIGDTREIDFQLPADGILMECRNQRQTVAVVCTIDNCRRRCSS